MKKNKEYTYNICICIYKYKLIVYNFISLYFRKINIYKKTNFAKYLSSILDFDNCWIYIDDI